MLLSALVTVAFQSVLASEFLDKCPIDLERRVDSVLLVDVLGTFYKDVVFVRAITESRQACNYKKLSEQVRYEHREQSDPIISENVYQTLNWIIDLLERKRVNEARFELNALKSFECVRDGREMTYLKYIEAELYRLAGDIGQACSSVLYAFMEREQSEGVSLDLLERLDGLIALQKVSQFNQDVDMFYGLMSSPNYKRLSLVHMILKDETMPLHKLRFRILYRLYETKPTLGSSYETPRTDPDQDDFSGQSMSGASAEDILCEFAQKLYILGVSSEEDTPANYSDVMNQLRQLDVDFANELNERVVTKIEAELESVKDVASEMATDFEHSSPRLGNEIQEIFALYFSLELHRRSEECCNLWQLDNLLEGFNRLRSSRYTYAGVSLGKIIELEAKIVLLWLACFHERVKLVFELEGNENEQQLAEKLDRFGTCNKTIPDSSLVQIRVRVDP